MALGHIEGDETARTTVYTKKMARAIVQDIIIFARKFTPSSTLLSNPLTEDAVKLCTVHKSNNQQVILNAQRIYAISQLPKWHPGNKAEIFMSSPTDLVFQPREWRMVHFGIVFSPESDLIGAPQILHDSLDSWTCGSVPQRTTRR